MTSRTVTRAGLFAGALALAPAFASGQPLATASSATLLHTQAPRTRLESLIPRLSAPRLLDGEASSLLALAAPASHRVTIRVPSHEAAPPSPFVSFHDNFAADYFRMGPINGWTWVGLGVGTAGVGLASVFLQLAGAGVPAYMPRVPGVATADNPVMLSVGSYALRYDTLGSLSMDAGISAISSNLLRLVVAPRDRRTVRYMRTYATELQGGWMFGVEGAL